MESAPDLFSSVEVDVGGYGIIWNDDLDLSCDELFENGEAVKTPFDELMAFTDAALLWGLNESPLRKAIAYGNLVNGVDARKYGKQWVISTDAMKREYGQPKAQRQKELINGTRKYNKIPKAVLQATAPGSPTPRP